MFTEYIANENTYRYREDRPVFILSSTSYTPDENFSTMVNALDKLQAKIDELSQINSEFAFPRI